MTATKIQKMIQASTHLSDRDLRDLLAEHGLDGITATRISQAR